MTSNLCSHVNRIALYVGAHNHLHPIDMCHKKMIQAEVGRAISVLPIKTPITTERFQLWIYIFFRYPNFLTMCTTCCFHPILNVVYARVFDGDAELRVGELHKNAAEAVRNF